MSNRLENYLASRNRKAQKIATILSQHLGGDLSSMHALDVGCSIGWIAHALSAQFGMVVGIDMERESLARAERTSAAGDALQFVIGDGSRLPFAAERFDVVVFAQVYEHVPRQQALADEIWRVLCPGGVCFFSGPNRLALIEEHYALPFLSWLPRPLAELYVRALRHGQRYDVYPRSYWSIRRMWRRFVIRDYTAHMLRAPEQYSVEDHVRGARMAGLMPDAALRALAPLFPNYNWILEKPS